MMKKNTILLSLISAAGLLVLCGCGDPAPEGTSPSGRNRLVIRLFRSMENGDAASAAVQAEKVRALDPGNVFFSSLIEQQECNAAVLQAQKALDAGSVDGAEMILNNARKLYPLQPTLGKELARIRQIRALQQAVQEYRAARTPADREAALNRVSQLVAPMRDPALAVTVAELQKKLKSEMAAEAAKRRATPAPSSSARKP